MTELADILLRANGVAALAIAAVLVLRLPARAAFGAEAAYRLWAAPPLAVAANLLPFKVAPAGTAALGHLAPAHLAGPLLAAWAAGAGVAVLLLWRAQAAFLRAARAGRAGPAVVGVIAPRVIMPPDDGRFSEAERALIRAHEREHICRKDPRAGALAALCQCLAWFNPLVHLAAHVARLDQELACDAAVIRKRPKDRALYARTLLKTQLAGAALPLGCYWPARARHPLELRVELLKRRRREGGLAGSLLIAAALTIGAFLATAAGPPLPRAPVPELPGLEEGGAGQMSVMLVTWRTSAPRR
ncbi:MAG TPA: M56 family metallopeptidase [Phenylobacterium sp.]|uniref:M56 family metallopeptidase n=1 Tax=Phenylobacterium sp. TaxID=1871053 RepID=UPI002B7C7BC8|nr:M56 family metallopeptidase [Phenylobacterium sp.]HSV01658.1 M56 family metallopeptidase [Phenylobacterium sp.]